MIDYAFKFADEASAKTALGGYWLESDGDWGWDLSRIMATTHCGSTASFQMFMGVDLLDGYFVSVSIPAVSETLWAIPECMVEGDRASSTVTRTRFDDEQQQAFNASPVMGGTAYVFPGRSKSFLLDENQHPIADNDGQILESDT